MSAILSDFKPCRPATLSSLVFFFAATLKFAATVRLVDAVLLIKMLRCVGFFEKFCRPLLISPDYTLETVKQAFLVKFPELKELDRVLIQVCRKLLSFM